MCLPQRAAYTHSNAACKLCRLPAYQVFRRQIMLSNCARTGRTLPVKALLSVLSLTLLAATSCVGSAVSAQPAQPAVWRGNSRAAAYTFSPVRTSPTVAWQYQLPMKSLFAPLTLDGDTLYVISQDSVLRALNVNTRQEKWSKFLA